MFFFFSSRRPHTRCLSDWSSDVFSSDLVGVIQGLYTQIQAVSRVNVASATLANTRQLEQLLLSRNPMNVPGVTANYQTLYRTVPLPQNASPQTRDLIDIDRKSAV